MAEIGYPTRPVKLAPEVHAYPAEATQISDGLFTVKSPIRGYEICLSIYEIRALAKLAGIIPREKKPGIRDISNGINPPGVE